MSAIKIDKFWKHLNKETVNNKLHKNKYQQ